MCHKAGQSELKEMIRVTVNKWLKGVMAAVQEWSSSQGQ
jgi:hypothetical protein